MASYLSRADQRHSANNDLQEERSEYNRGAYAVRRIEELGRDLLNGEQSDIHRGEGEESALCDWLQLHHPPRVDRPHEPIVRLLGRPVPRARPLQLYALRAHGVDDFLAKRIARKAVVVAGDLEELRERGARSRAVDACARAASPSRSLSDKEACAGAAGRSEVHKLCRVKEEAPSVQDHLGGGGGDRRGEGVACHRL
eukprot:CAMPEP_0113286648 /NCGR_PEP_ID=MMETSP0008_2-20120614/31260_1 /TAXON_ID=97485 /ORGANISM="Prymnesium parvum" /LENGTH=197 /DNA_ID=CAMNT_0000137773 /DNA_START=180 /DNA_END=774 /DNA_ORIENTATION=- /assembly_acc=CAM_ASM_000153